MKTTRTHYDNLKVTRDAPSEVIEAAYRALSLKYGVQSNSHAAGARVRRLIDDAYAVLSSAEHRRRHDEWIGSTDRRSVGEQLRTWMHSRSALSKVYVAAIVILGFLLWGHWSRNEFEPRGVTSYAAAPSTSSETSVSLSEVADPQVQTPLEVGALPQTVPKVSKAKSVSPSLHSDFVNADEWIPVAPDTAICGTPLRLPDTEVMTTTWVPESAGSAELRIRTGDEIGNVYAKVLSAFDRQVVATVFVRRNDQARISLQPGSYRLRYMPVATWYGADLVKWCASAPPTEGDDAIELNSPTSRGDATMTDIVVVELKQRLHGNFSTHKIPLEDF